MSTFIILPVVAAFAFVVSACEGLPASSQGSAGLSAGGTAADVGPPSSQPNPIAVVVGPTGLRAR